ncbi:MAG TPA: hypothetical protein PLA90_09880 [Candidatus Sumerlaeota bacterium]|nr:hypothetical protein [Candidatus Sumerlaeota bacterium]
MKRCLILLIGIPFLMLILYLVLDSLNRYLISIPVQENVLPGIWIAHRNEGIEIFNFSDDRTFSQKFYRNGEIVFSTKGKWSVNYTSTPPSPKSQQVMILDNLIICRSESGEEEERPVSGHALIWNYPPRIMIDIEGDYVLSKKKTKKDIEKAKKEMPSTDFSEFFEAEE